MAPGSAFDPDEIAEEYWRLHTQPAGAWEREVLYPGPAGRGAGGRGTAAAAAGRRRAQAEPASSQRVALTQRLGHEMGARPGAEFGHGVAHVGAHRGVEMCRCSAISGPVCPAATSRTISLSRGDSVAVGRRPSGSRREWGPQRDVLDATNSTRRSPVTTSVWPAYCTVTVLPSAHTGRPGR